MLAETLYQGNPDRNYKLWNIGSTETYTPYAGATGMLLLINGMFTVGKIEIISFIIKVRS